LNYEDLIGGDLPTRYKYLSVPKEDFGMSAIDILFADDKELNKAIPLKSFAPYKNDFKEKYQPNKRNRGLDKLPAKKRIKNDNSKPLFSKKDKEKILPSKKEEILPSIQQNENETKSKISTIKERKKRNKMKKKQSKHIE